MGGGDLNMKKSWHPATSANKYATAKAEADAIAERKKTQARLAEIAEDRKREEIQKALEAAGRKPRLERVEFMYNGPSDGQASDATELEGYLLGKRRIDKLIQGDESKKGDQQISREGLIQGPGARQSVGYARDTVTKIREDPLLAIKRKEQEAYEAAMNDPIKKRQIMASLGIKEEPHKKSGGREGKRHRHRHYHRHHRDEGSEDERRQRRHRSYSRDRFTSPRRRDIRHDERRGSRRELPDRSRRISDLENGCIYTSRRDERRRVASPSRSPRKRIGGSYSRSPPRKRDSPLSRYGNGHRDNNHRSREERNSASIHQHRGDYGKDETPKRNGHSNGTYSDRPPFAWKKQDEERRLCKLAEMQSAATDLDKARGHRLAIVEKVERVAEEADDRARESSRKYGGGDRQFMNSLHCKAGQMQLADRIGRMRQGLQRDDD